MLTCRQNVNYLVPAARVPISIGMRTGPTEWLSRAERRERVSHPLSGVPGAAGERRVGLLAGMRPPGLELVPTIDGRLWTR
jgi:hypothetical protein